MLRLAHKVGVLVMEGVRHAISLFVVTPVVRSLAESGRGLRVEQVPYVRGGGRIVLGEGLRVSGKIAIAFSRRTAHLGPTLQIGDRTFIGHQSSFAIAQRVCVGSDCLIAGSTHIQDNDGHPLDPGRRKAKEPVPEDTIRPVTIGDNVWIGARSRIMKGGTIRDNAVIGACSVVTKDVAPGTIVAGNPAKFIRDVDPRDSVGI